MNSSSEGPTSDKPDKTSKATPLFPEFELPAHPKVRRYKRLDKAIWTENKAQFIREYLKYFVQITKHGAYIDGFAGPQSYRQLDSWCAALVMRSEPKWLRHFFLCEISRRGIDALKRLVASQPVPRDKKGRKLPRKIKLYHGDFNVEIDSILGSGEINQKEATFCLLDQRTFECKWASLQKLAKYKKSPQNKIEILYFLGVGWLHRAFSGIGKSDKALKWWGKSNWRELRDLSSYQIVELLRDRFKSELGYAYVAAYPIFDRKEGKRVMYYMIHASDHEEAPALMIRAHNRAVRAKPAATQRPLPF